jgi:hypothetical protein
MINSNKTSKGILDLITIIAMIGCWVSTDTAKGPREAFRNGLDDTNNFSWGTPHSILSIVFTVLLVVHIWQHWKLIKLIVIKNLYSKNIVTSLTLLTFIVTVASFLIYFTGFSHSKGEFHGTVANIFLIAGCIHLVLNFKKMLALFEGSLIKEGTMLHNYVSGSYTPKVEAVFLSLFRRNDKNSK